MNNIDLNELAHNGRVRNLTGHERGLKARDKFNLSKLDEGDEVVDVLVPEYIDAVTISFFQGLFADSIRVAGRNFFDKYHFKASPVVMKQIVRGFERVNTNRGLSPFL